MTEATRPDYDDAPYPRYSFPQTLPDALASAARLVGLEPPPPDRCRVLEFGCARGDNLLPMASAFPGCEFVGVELSRRQCEDAREVLREIGLENVKILHADLRALPEEIGTFDYVIAHGVYSWVPDDVKDGLLAAASRCLAPGGLAYVSYNTWPGWHLRATVRDMLLFHARDTEGAGRRVSKARDLLEFLARGSEPDTSPAARHFREVALRIMSKSDNYLLHEDLGSDNDPVWFHQFLAHARAHGLDYLCEVPVELPGASGFPPEVERSARLLAADPADQEQYLDFLKGRAFRQSLLVRAGGAAARRPGAGALDGFRVASPLRHVGEDLFHAEGGRSLRTSDLATRAALIRLSEVWPESLPFAELKGLAEGPDQVALLEAHLLRASCDELVELRTLPPVFTIDPPGRPRATPYARRQASLGPEAVNLRHEAYNLAHDERRMLMLLDGTRDRDALCRDLGGPDMRALEGTLQRLARLAFVLREG